MESLGLSQRMCSLGINEEEESSGNQLTQVHLEKWLLKWSVCLWLQEQNVHIAINKNKCSNAAGWHTFGISLL